MVIVSTVSAVLRFTGTENTYLSKCYSFQIFKKSKFFSVNFLPLSFRPGIKILQQSLSPSLIWVGFRSFGQFISLLRMTETPVI